jgi:hypothetical protein
VTRNNIIPEALSTIIETVLTLIKAEVLAPGAGFATAAIGRYLFGRYERGRAILRSQLERAGATAEDFKDTEQFAAAALRYVRAVRDQAADENLRVLAQAMIGLARRQELWASDFLKFAEILAPLSRDELILIGFLMNEHKAFYSTPRPANSDGKLWRIVTKKSQDLFPSLQYIFTVATRAQRSGLIMQAIAGYGGGYFQLSPIGVQLREIVDILPALQSGPGE